MKTHEGAKAEVLSKEDQLRRTVLSCMLWENTFYESGQSIEDRISTLSKEVDPKIVSYLAMEARKKYKLRSVPLLLANELAKKGGNLVSKTLENIIQRPDELVKFMELYWKNGKTPISKQVKKGLASTFHKFNEYQLAKWNKKGSIHLRDIMFLTHPKPKDDEQWNIWKKLADGELETPDTWEVGLSAAKTTNDKKMVWETLLDSNKLGALALLKNLRNMEQVNVDRSKIVHGLRNMNTDRVLPYRFVTAAKYAPSLVDYLEGAMYKCMANREKIAGKTVLLVDISGSMDDRLNKKTETTRIDTAIGLAILLKFLCDNVAIYTFSNSFVKVSDCSGFRLGEKIMRSQGHGGTYLGKAVKGVTSLEKDFDRMIIITDEQSHDNIENTIPSKGYIMNVASYRNGIEHGKEWTRINGFSEAVIDWMIENERPAISWTRELDELFTFSWSEI